MATDIIDFINSLRRPGGGEIGERGASQIRFTAFPPGSTVTQVLRPRSTHYAAFGYRLTVGSEVIPEAFTVSVAYSGGGFYAGTLTQKGIEDGFTNLALLTHVNPMTVQAVNVSGLFQYMEVILSFVTIPTKEDLDIVYRALGELAMTGHNEMIAETNRLLRAIRTALVTTPLLPGPPPPALPALRR